MYVGGFIGCDALKTIKEQGTTRRLVGLQMIDRGIARHGYDLYVAGQDSPCGVVTSGTKSPSTGEAIAMGYVAKPHHTAGSRLEVDIRGRRVAAEVVKTPFYRKDAP